MNNDFCNGQLLGEYELLAPMAKGGMAVVWIARKVAGSHVGRLVAIKTLLEADEQTRIALHDEAALTVAIDHENVASLLDSGEHEGVPYLVMEWIDGEPLDIILQKAAHSGGLPVELAIDWMIQACRGLHAAHELRGADGELRGLIHRDISPQNVMVTCDGTVKLVDFGIAKASQRNTHTQLGQIKGKVAYMSPEQVRGSALDRRVDVFAMGIVLYLLTTGRHPFKAQTPAETIRRICFAGPPLAPSKIVAEYPSALEPIVMKALSTDRDERHPTALALAEELEAVLSGLARHRSGESYLRPLLADRVANRRALLDEAIEEADAQRLARNAPTARPPRSRPSISNSEPTLPEIPRDGDISMGSFSSLRALILTAMTSTAPATGEDTRAPAPLQRKARPLAALALAAAVAASVILSIGLASRPAAPAAERARTAAGAPQRLVERTLSALRAKSSP